MTALPHVPHETACDDLRVQGKEIAVLKVEMADTKSDVADIKSKIDRFQWYLIGTLVSIVITVLIKK